MHNNATKTKITKPTKLKYLGFGFWMNNKTQKWEARPHEDAVAKLIAKLKGLCNRSWSISLSERIKKINEVTRGWINYYRIGAMRKIMKKVDEHLRTKIRMIIWKQWKVPSKRQWALQKLGVNKDLARLTSYCGDRYYWVVTKTVVVRAISKEKLALAGLVSPLDYYLKQHTLKLQKI